jgi:hypothetical protein
MRIPRRVTLYPVELGRIERERIEATKEDWRQADLGRGLFDPPARRLRSIHAAAAAATLSRPKKLLVMSGRTSAAGIEERVTRTSGCYVARTHAFEGEAQLFFTIRTGGTTPTTPKRRRACAEPARPWRSIT